MDGDKMGINYQTLSFEYQPCREQQGGTQATAYPVIVVGAGPVGLATAIDVAQQGVPVVLIDDDCSLSTGSRAICFSKRSLDIFDRLGCGQRMVDKGISWNVGKVFLKDELVYTFNLLPESGHNRPAFINLQQYYVEGYLLERARELPNLEIRWKSKVVGIRQDGAPGSDDANVTLTVETPDGQYPLCGRYVVAADGSRSPIRNLMGLDTHGRTFKDRFLIADVKMEAEFPTERWFWFDPPFHAGRSALLHRQPDDIWRIDLQLHPDADPVIERKPENVRPRIARMLGHDKFEFEWISLYKFQCRRMERFLHGRVLFAGDAAHQVSPFGARGANSGLEDAENLAWKLDRVLRGTSPEALLETYHSERSAAADENIRESTRSTDFMAPVTNQEARLRKAVLSLAKETEFGKRMINGGRLSVPSVYDSPLSTADRDTWRGGPRPGTSMPDAPVAQRAGDAGFLTEAFIRAGTRFTLLEFSNGAAADVPDDVARIRVGGDGIADSEGIAAQRYDAEPGSAYLLRPDGYVAARFRHPTRAALDAALARASGFD